MSMLKDILALLPEQVASGYDGLSISTDHYERMRREHLNDSPNLLQSAGYTYGGIRVAPNPIVPDGYAIAMSQGKPVGVIDFAAKTATFTKPE